MVDDSPFQRLSDAVKSHPLIGLLIAGAALVGITWAVIDNLVVEPLRDEITRIRNNLPESRYIQVGSPIRIIENSDGAELIVLKAAMRDGDAVISADGLCVVKMTAVRSNSADLEITFPDSQKRIPLTNLNVDAAMTVAGDGLECELQIEGIHKDRATIVVTRARSNKAGTIERRPTVEASTD